MSKVSPETINNMVNSILKPYYSKNRDVIVRYTVDATPVEVDINIVKQYVKPEHLDDLKLKWGYSKTKGNYIGYKVTVTIDNKSKCPISILIHPGSPHDSKIFDKVLKELKRRRLFKKRTIILFDKGYYSYKNYRIGLNIYKIIPIIFPRYYNTTQKLEDNLSYPLDIYNSRTYEEDKQEFNHLKHILIEYINNWKDLKPERGLIEDFFKVGKDAFGLGKFHKYTTRSITKSIYLCMLLTAICVQQGYDTKTKMQQLAEGNVELRPPKKHRNKKKTKKAKNNKKPKVPYKTGQQKLEIKKIEKQVTLFECA